MVLNFFNKNKNSISLIFSSTQWPIKLDFLSQEKHNKNLHSLPLLGFLRNQTNIKYKNNWLFRATKSDIPTQNMKSNFSSFFKTFTDLFFFFQFSH